MGNVDADYVLIVDDSATQRKHMQQVLEGDGMASQTAGSASEAIEAIHVRTPIAVVTDLEMPDMSGLQLVQTLRGTHPSLPVILTTSRGSEDVAAEALRHGAASYVPKRAIAETLGQVLRQVLSTTEAVRSAKAIGKFATRASIELEIDNDETLVPKVISRLETMLEEIGTYDEGDRMQVAMALDEALLNAIVHGNLEVPSSLREVEDGTAYQRLIDQRKLASPYRERRVRVTLEATRESAEFVITDMGPGYDPNELCDATDEEHIEGFGGRGMLMIGAFMDDVQHNDCGNEIKMIKRCSADEAA